MFSKISEEDVEFAKEFVNSDNKDKKKDLINILTKNGINEKNPFDPDVISNSVNVSFDIYKKEIEIFLIVYERTKKLFEEIQANDVKLDKHKKLINDSNSKLHFLAAKKDYIVGFLDNERIAAIYDKKIHRKLMLEACRNFNADLIHIDNLYDILLKEIASRASKRLYKDKYDKSYLLNIEKVSEDVGEEINKLKANAVAVVNLNYWRIDGISKIQDVFEKDVKEIYGRNLDEIFPKSEKNNNILESTENSIIKEKTRKNSKYKKLKSSKSVLENAINKMQNQNNAIVKENTEVSESEKPISQEDDNTDYNNLFEKISMLDELDGENPKTIENNDNKDTKPQETSLEEDSNTEDNVESDESNKSGEKSLFEENNDENEIEESIFDYYYKELDAAERKRKLRDEKKLNKDDQRSNIFKKIIGFNSKKQKEA